MPIETFTKEYLLAGVPFLYTGDIKSLNNLTLHYSEEQLFTDACVSVCDVFNYRHANFFSIWSPLSPGGTVFFSKCLLIDKPNG